MVEFLIILSSIFLGFQLKSIIDNISNIRKEKKRVKLKNDVFKEILLNLKSSTFKSRLNNTVYISTTLKSEGDVDLVYLIDKINVHIFKDDNCIYTSDDVDKEVIDSIIEFILNKFEKEINDVVQVFGITFNRIEFENHFGIKIEDLKKGIKMEDLSLIDQSDIDQIYHETEMKFDIDEILDRINVVGIKNLTQAELNFLKEYSSGKKD
jgi:uncharacterized protein (UPF0335 family)